MLSQKVGSITLVKQEQKFIADETLNSQRNKVYLETKNVKENETEKEKIFRLRLKNEYALPLTKEEIELVSKSQHDDEEEA